MNSDNPSLSRRIRRLVSRSHWLTRLFRLSVSKGSSKRRGLLLIQIDGLSHPQFIRALKKGEMPFLKRLVTRKQYQLHSQYSGLPSATPAAQAELFYGIKTAVPAFSFQDHKNRQIIRMYEPDAATHVEERLQTMGHIPLLTGGSAYTDNFTGGAEEAHFCPASLGWGPTFQNANPLAFLFFLLSNLFSFVRIGFLLILETILATVDFLRGLSHGHNFLKELKFIPTRVAISILLRELSIIGGQIDMERGLPIIHINFLGYDEQAHRRGPDSLFAHWTLKGIDKAIARLWHAAHRAHRRQYQVWIYSDHGQHAALSYSKLQGYTLEEAVEKVFSLINSTATSSKATPPHSIETQRVRLLGGHHIQKLFSVAGLAPEPEETEALQVASLGPVGFVYAPHTLARDERSLVARELVRNHRVPVALICEEPDRLHAWTETDEYILPEQTAELFGSDHPFLEEIKTDLLTLCQHPDAGDVTLLGWHKGVKPVTFAIENGSHAGANPEETHAFSLLPHSAPLPARHRDFLRHGDLREAVLSYLKTTESVREQDPE